MDPTANTVIATPSQIDIYYNHWYYIPQLDLYCERFCELWTRVTWLKTLPHWADILIRRSVCWLILWSPLLFWAVVSSHVFLSLSNCYLFVYMYKIFCCHKSSSAIILNVWQTWILWWSYLYSEFSFSIWNHYLLKVYHTMLDWSKTRICLTKWCKWTCTMQ